MKLKKEFINVNIQMKKESNIKKEINNDKNVNLEDEEIIDLDKELSDSYVKGIIIYLFFVQLFFLINFIFPLIGPGCFLDYLLRLVYIYLPQFGYVYL